MSAAPDRLTKALSGEGRHRTKRVLVTGLSTYWGGRLAQALEGFEEIEAIVGVDNVDPTRDLERTEFVKVGNQHSLIERIVRAAEIDTVIDTRLVVDAITTTSRLAHENNVIGTMNILAACTGDDSPVRKFIFKSSAHYYGCEQDDPAFFTEEMRRPHPARTSIERDIVEAEASVAEFADKRAETSVTILRFANVMGPDVRTSHVRMFALPMVPMIFGFDPRYQFVHEDDVVHALEHAALNQLPGLFNVAADGVLALSEVISLLGKRPLPVLPPWGTGLMTGPLRRLGLRIPDEMLNQLRFGRGLDNRKYKTTGFRYTYTSREAAQKLGEHLRLSAVVRGAKEPFRYEREVEEFLRWSPHVNRDGAEVDGSGQEPEGLSARQMRQLQEVMRGTAEGGRRAARRVARTAGAALRPKPTADAADTGELETEEVIALLGEMDDPALEALERRERDGRARPAVLEAISRVRAAS
jgi:UDP-glucose 4-epimerase